MSAHDGSGTRDTPGSRGHETAASGSYTLVREPGAAALGGALVSVVGYEAVSTDPYLHRGLPSPSLTLVFSLDEPIVSGETPAQAAGERAHRSRIILGGLHHRPSYVWQPPRQTGIQLAVHPLAARALFGMPAGELAAGVAGMAVEGTAVLGAEAEHLRERMCEQPCDRSGWAERFTLLGDFLRRRAEDHAAYGGGSSGWSGSSGVRAEVAEAWRWLARHRGAGSLDGLAAHVALSRRQLTTLFRQELGASPKQISRLMRWARARRAVASAVAETGRPDLSGIAARCGYYDHSHLVRDFRQYAGLSPTAWIAEEHRNIQAGGHHADGE